MNIHELVRNHRLISALGCAGALLGFVGWWLIFSQNSHKIALNVGIFLFIIEALILAVNWSKAHAKENGDFQLWVGGLFLVLLFITKKPANANILPGMIVGTVGGLAVAAHGLLNHLNAWRGSEPLLKEYLEVINAPAAGAEAAAMPTQDEGSDGESESNKS